MILEQLTVRDFCLFSGQQTFDLTPAPRLGVVGKRPIVLFGGTNGTGKTTLLDAIQLALYGVRARCSKRANLAYDEFLRQSIHHGTSESEGAAVSLTFRSAAEGEEHLYEVRRSWRVQGKTLREELKVFQDGIFDRWHSEHWSYLVEGFFPLEVSQLFFFDAEKIRTLAEDETSSQVLATAVKSLLGLDIAERLIADVAAIEADLTKEAATAQPQEGRDDFERVIAELQAAIDAQVAQRGEIENLLLRTKAEQEQEEAAFAAAGGRHWEARDEREHRLKRLQAEVKDCDARLVSLAATELPLGLVRGRLEDVERQDSLERAATEAEIIRHLLSERDDRLLDLLAAAKARSELVEKVRGHLAEDRRSRSAVGEVTPRLSLSEGARSLLQHLLRQRLGELRRETEEVLARRAQLVREIEDAEHVLSITPEDDERIAQFLLRLRTLTERLTTLTADAKRVDAVIAERRSSLETQKARLRSIKEREVKEEFAWDTQRRMAWVAGRTQVVMKEFLGRATERKIDRLSGLISESFRFLLHKQTMVARIEIDPKTFAVMLYNKAGQALAKERLSEGEKQIFAISILWGLARASEHPLPAIIDTPMARLDAAHRRNLIERYFPNASHQVIILSTDTEVDRHYYQALQPHIARAYHLCYDEEARATRAEEGYFWRESPDGGDVRSPA